VKGNAKLDSFDCIEDWRLKGNNEYTNILNVEVFHDKI
jgi:hypothetical protein